VGPAPADESLMLAYRSGEVRAFEELARRHRAAVFNFILRLVGDRGRAEDLLQETWLKVIRVAPSYEKKAKFTTWLYTIARNLCVDSMRRERYRKADSLDAAVDSSEDSAPRSDHVAGDGPSPDRAAHAASLRPKLEKALAALPAEQREVFVLREYGGIAFREIAEVTGVPENTVKSRMRYALESLRKQLTALGIEGDMADEEAAARAMAR
jgi:RNA polymerase sigma-70 factor (ECF subfamily)